MRSTTNVFLPAVLAACLLFAGCYQAKVTTNKAAGDKVVQKKWASSFIFGLVPATVDVSDECPNGISSAQRKFSFLNGLVSQLTFGIYLPQNVKVTCASGGTMSSSLVPSKTNVFLPRDASDAQLQKKLSTAVAEAPSQQTVTVHLQSD